MKVALIHNVQVPVYAYGGTERVLWWLAKGLHERGVKVVLACAPGSRSDFGEVRPLDYAKSLSAQLSDVDVEHHFASPAEEPNRPYLVGVGGNGRLGERYYRNTVFVSRNHAERHGAKCFVHNGIDPDEYLFRENKESQLIFLAKASRRVKNVRGAQRIARAAGFNLHIVGGRRLIFAKFRGSVWKGMLGGRAKAEELAAARGLLFPVIWNEPFGLAVVEALVSGTPVVASRRGSLPELIGSEVGILGESEAELVSAVKELGAFSPRRCREWALDLFHYRKMTDGYCQLYQRLLSGEFLNPGIPQASEPPEKIFPLN